jgi:hypothetical protein
MFSRTYLLIKREWKMKEIAICKMFIFAAVLEYRPAQKAERLFH